MQDLSGKKVLITGACGTVGAELVNQLLATDAAHIVSLDNNETELFFLNERHRSTGRHSGYLADIRDREALLGRLSGVDIVLHAAALKHVGLCEDSPMQAVQTNILGTQNVIDAALENDVERVIFTSSDKAVNPTNVMGTAKLMGERLMSAASNAANNGRTVFASTRFGNVLGSRGSVVPLFRRQIENGGPITLTDSRMTRFVMTVAEAASLVLRSVPLAKGGEVFVTKMPVARIVDIAHAMRESSSSAQDIEVHETGPKPGEKMYEELMNDEEVRRTYEHGDFFVVVPAFVAGGESRYAYLDREQRAERPYNSEFEEKMSRDEVTRYLKSRHII